MNMISELRNRCLKNGSATLTIDEFNQLQAEWITRYADQEIVNKVKADAVRSILDETESWSVMNTYAVTVEDIAEYADKIERGE